MQIAWMKYSENLRGILKCEFTAETERRGDIFYLLNETSHDNNICI